MLRSCIIKTCNGKTNSLGTEVEQLLRNFFLATFARKITAQPPALFGTKTTLDGTGCFVRQRCKVNSLPKMTKSSHTMQLELPFCCDRMAHDKYDSLTTYVISVELFSQSINNTLASCL